MYCTCARNHTPDCIQLTKDALVKLFWDNWKVSFKRFNAPIDRWQEKTAYLMTHTYAQIYLLSSTMRGGRRQRYSMNQMTQCNTDNRTVRRRAYDPFTVHKSRMAQLD